MSRPRPTFAARSILALFPALFLGCSDPSPAEPDGPTAPDAAVDAPPPGTCAEQQRAQVDRRIAPDQQTAVETTIAAVVRASDFPTAMPYCSGQRPTAK